MNITPEETAKASAIMHEGVKKALQIKELYSDSTRDMMVFMATLEALRLLYPGLFGCADRKKVAMMILHWVAAGEPERPGAVPGRLLTKFGPEAFREIEETYAPIEGDTIQ
jgi:hypothetical protein